MSALQFVRMEFLAFLAALTAILFYRSLTGRLALVGLLSDGSRRGVSPERVQLLLITMFVSVQYVRSVAHGTGVVLPDVNTPTLILFGGSSGIYATLKAATFWKRSRGLGVAP